MLSPVPAVLIEILSEDNGSVVPSDLIKAYLSSSNGKKDSLADAVTSEESWLLTISTVRTFLIVKFALLRSTVAISDFGKRV